MPRVRSPKRGSRGFSPRKRAKSIIGRIKYWPEHEGDPTLLGFAGYKAGMTHVFLIEDRDRAPDFGKEMKNAVTIIDTPPMLIIGLRAYEKTYDGLMALTEAWMDIIPVDIYRRIKTHGGASLASGLKRMEKVKDYIAELRVIVATQPRLASVEKKKPELMEIVIGGGSVDDQIEYAKGLIGETLSVSDVFAAGESIDVIGVTKGKGFQGPVKRWGIRILQRKSRKSVRAVGSIGPWKPRRVMPGVPRAGQMGFHNRTEFNKRIVIMDSDGDKINPKGGIHKYGLVKGDYILLKGSVMGPQKRLIKLRKAVRKSRYPPEPPQVTYINTEFLNKMEAD